jgi:hypothetical protein
MRNDQFSTNLKRMNVKKMRLLLDIFQKISTLDTLDEILAQLIEITSTELGAERGTIFLNDPETGELFSRMAQGNLQREIRLLNSSGIAGTVFQTGKSIQKHRFESFRPDIKRTGKTSSKIVDSPVERRSDKSRDTLRFQSMLNEPGEQVAGVNIHSQAHMRAVFLNNSQRKEDNGPVLNSFLNFRPGHKGHGLIKDGILHVKVNYKSQIKNYK